MGKQNMQCCNGSEIRTWKDNRMKHLKTLIPAAVVFLWVGSAIGGRTLTLEPTTMLFFGTGLIGGSVAVGRRRSQK